jgi:hypothetical protein
MSMKWDRLRDVDRMRRQGTEGAADRDPSFMVPLLPRRQIRLVRRLSKAEQRAELQRLVAEWERERRES